MTDILQQANEIASKVQLPLDVSQFYGKGQAEIEAENKAQRNQLMNETINNMPQGIQTRPNHLIVQGRHYKIIGFTNDGQLAIIEL